MIRFIILFSTLFFSCLFINMKISSILNFIIYQIDETKQSRKYSFITMIIAIFFITVYITLY